jgi:heme-degrading monooxygenase HmoA
MVRIVYRWQVAPNDFETFRKAWRETTNHIHASIAGALGSFMLRSTEDDSEVVTVAKWDSLDSWRHFWANDNPEEMRRMSRWGKRISFEAFEEIEDRTA